MERYATTSPSFWILCVRCYDDATKKKKRRNVREDVSPGAHSYSSQQERNMAISVSFHYRFKGTVEYERAIGGHDSKFGPIAHIIERSTDLSVRRRGHLQWLSTTARK